MNLSEITDISVTLNVAIVSQIYAYVQNYQNNALNMHRFLCTYCSSIKLLKKISKPGVSTSQSICAGPGRIRTEARQDSSRPALRADSGFKLVVTESQGHSRGAQGRAAWGMGLSSGWLSVGHRSISVSQSPAAARRWHPKPGHGPGRFPPAQLILCGHRPTTPVCPQFDFKMLHRAEQVFHPDGDLVDGKPSES